MLRFLDMLISAFGLLLLGPVLCGLALAIKLADGGLVLYRAKRIGKGGRPFEVLKFRTMVPNADAMGEGITSAGDKRVSPLGRFLRKFKLDELPQLVNVLKGEMSLVGARPEDPQYVALYNDHQRKVLAFRPGITSPASLHFRDEESLLSGSEWRERYINDILPRKLSMDLSYLLQRTLWGDVKIIMRTLGGILK